MSDIKLAQAASAPKHSSSRQQQAPIPRKRKAAARPGPGKARQAANINALKEAVLALGYTPGSKFAAQALGIKGRSTLWAIFNSKHRRGGLSSKTVKRLLAAEGVSKGIRKIVQQYVRERLAGVYGHTRREIEVYRFRVDAGLSRTGMRPTRCV
jgi:hypothetical protein